MVYLASNDFASPRRRARIPLVGVVALCVLALCWVGCDGAGPQAEPETEAPSEPPPEPPPSGSVQQLNCDMPEVACSPADVPPAVLERSSTLQQDAQQRMNEGEAASQTAEWLREQEDIAFVLTNEHALVFVVENSIPMVIYDAVAATEGVDPAKRAIRRSVRRDGTAKGVVGRGTPRDNPDRNKTALVLSPFDFEHMVPDAGPQSVGILGGIPDYDSRVVYLTDEEVDLGAFTGWDAYDVVAYNGHGGVVDVSYQGQEFETSFFVTGQEVESCNSPAVQAISTPGVTCVGVKIAYEDIIGRLDVEYRNYVGLNPAFFTNTYPTGLEKAALILNACDSAASSLLPEYLAGASSVVFGWTETVLATKAAPTTIQLMEELAKGLPSQDALDAVCASVGCVDTGGKGAELVRFATGNDLRIREIVTIKGPSSGNGKAGELPSGATIPFLGAPGDGEPDALLMYVEVAGVEAGTEDDYRVDVTVNGTSVGSVGLTGDDVTRLDETTVEAKVKKPLGFDVSPGQVVEIEAVATLPESGESSDDVTVALDAPELFVQAEITSQTPDGKIQSVVEGEIDLKLGDQEGTTAFSIEESSEELTHTLLALSLPECNSSGDGLGGTFEMLGGSINLDPSSGRLGMPDAVVLLPLSDFRESITCQGVTLENQNWWSGFMALHGGAGPGGSEFDPATGGFAIEEWSPGTEGAAAVKTYDRSFTDNGTVVTEKTRFEIRLPQY